MESVKKKNFENKVYGICKSDISSQLILSTKASSTKEFEVDSYRRSTVKAADKSSYIKQMQKVINNNMIPPDVAGRSF